MGDNRRDPYRIRKHKALDQVSGGKVDFFEIIGPKEDPLPSLGAARSRMWLDLYCKALNRAYELGKAKP